MSDHSKKTCSSSTVTQGTVVRHPYKVRVAHWIVVLCFLLTALSGLGLLFPSLHWLLNILGTGQLARILHPFLGVTMAVVFLVLFFCNAKHNLPERGDGQWFKNLTEILKGREHSVADVGHYNPGQKLLFWGICGLLCGLVATGIVIWRPYFAENFSIPLIRAALLLHALCAVLLILSIMVHVYMAFWYKGTTRGMVYGTVTRAWAKRHHPKWLRKISEENNLSEKSDC